MLMEKTGSTRQERAARTMWTTVRLCAVAAPLMASSAAMAQVPLPAKLSDLTEAGAYVDYQGLRFESFVLGRETGGSFADAITVTPFTTGGSIGLRFTPDAGVIAGSANDTSQLLEFDYHVRTSQPEHVLTGAALNFSGVATGDAYAQTDLVLDAVPPLSSDPTLVALSTYADGLLGDQLNDMGTFDEIAEAAAFATVELQVFENGASASVQEFSHSYSATVPEPSAALGLTGAASAALCRRRLRPRSKNWRH